jgi:predicted metal-binding membrane protein
MLVMLAAEIANLRRIAALTALMAYERTPGVRGGVGRRRGPPAVGALVLAHALALTAR